MTAPEWLTTRNGHLSIGPNGRSVFVTLHGTPQWRLDPMPAKGKFTCAVLQTNNGKRLDAGKEYATRDEAVSGGLEELRVRLGW